MSVERRRDFSERRLYRSTITVKSASGEQRPDGDESVHPIVREGDRRPPRASHDPLHHPHPARQRHRRRGHRRDRLRATGSQISKDAWWGRGDSNSHAARAHDPKSCASAVPPLPHDVYRIASPTGDADGGDGGGGAEGASSREAQDAPRRTLLLLRRLNARPAWPATSQAASAAGRRARAAP